MSALGSGGRPHIVLIGAGHANLYLMRHRHRLADADMTIVDPGAFWYSGMAAGALGGAHEPAEIRVDPVRLARRYGLASIRGRLSGLDRSERKARLTDGRTLDYDLISLNLGSSAPTLTAHPDGPRVWAVKPIARLIALRHQLTSAYERGEHPALVVVGGGASGVELACNLRSLAVRYASPATITLISSTRKLIPTAPAGARRWLEGYLRRIGVVVRVGMRAVSHHRDGLLMAEEGVPMGQDALRLLECEHVIHAGGLAPPGALDGLGLTLIGSRGLAVHSTLQSVDDPDVFAAGDCAALVEHALPRLGVYGVRQAPVLLANLKARLQGSPLQRYRPQAQALTILNLGQDQGLAIRGRLWWAGRSSLLWKHWLDERFMTRYRH
ncbi:NAD(P)/FAD-dependent oxidoreductase [Billgrantia ethanolica]|uniref:FAD-dependent oxidoreductase n=1 Tax=Billgrantia ethanolica TaxID=2733486 RepID=A0ABS8ZZG3_9GAMM|nr:FAD-dependent oxidoreductase [Halomonas ethanolica]MCE8001977.1 FAD-dependent oxidoreductase [Halomonas ethanolica]